MACESSATIAWGGLVRSDRAVGLTKILTLFGRTSVSSQAKARLAAHSLEVIATRIENRGSALFGPVFRLLCKRAAGHHEEHWEIGVE